MISSYYEGKESQKIQRVIDLKGTKSEDYKLYKINIGTLISFIYTFPWREK